MVLFGLCVTECLSIDGWGALVINQSSQVCRCSEVINIERPRLSATRVIAEEIIYYYFCCYYYLNLGVFLRFADRDDVLKVLFCFFASVVIETNGESSVSVAYNSTSR